jgi:signal transduction histidine kinase/ActR/RegA family two-component response regulator
LLTDGLMQRYVGMILIVDFLQTLESENRWSPYLVIGIIGSLSVAIVLFYLRVHFQLSFSYFLVAYALEILSTVAVIYRGSQAFRSSENALVIWMLLGIYVAHVVTLMLCQSCFEWDIWIQYRYVKMGANYTIVAACTLPAVMPARFEREKARCAERANEFRRCFIRYISHEIRTPLNVSTVGVAIMEDILKSRDMLSGEVSEILEQTKQALTISTEILNDMLTFEKLNANAMVLEQTLERPVDFVLSAAGLFEFQARDKGVRLQLPLSSSHLRDTFIFVDTYKMSQVVRNLVSNALKFTSYGGAIIVTCETVHKVIQEPTSGQTRASTVPMSEWLRISVMDDGAGIAPENLGKLFKGIVQFDANRLQGGRGTGLGMFISYGIVELHGGILSVHSDGLGRGCTFTVELPLIRMHSDGDDCSRLVSHQGICAVRSMGYASTADDVSEFNRPNVDSHDSPHRQVPSRKLQQPSVDEEDPEDHSPRGINELMPVFTIRQSISSGSSIIDDDPSSNLPSGAHSVNIVNICSHSRLSSLSRRESTRTRRNTFEILKDMESGKILVPQPGKSLITSQASTLDLRDCRILIVDDSPMNLKMMALMMKKFGADCVTAANGAEAVQLVRDALCCCGGHIDIVIMDNNMDVMNGIQACQLMRDAGFMNPIFGLTGDVDENCDKEFLGAGANRVLSKPLKLQEIVETLTLCSL